MGQMEVLEMLKKEYVNDDKVFFNSKKISEGINISRASVDISLRKLRHTGLVEFKESFIENTLHKEFVYRFSSPRSNCVKFVRTEKHIRKESLAWKRIKEEVYYGIEE